MSPTTMEHTNSNTTSQKPLEIIFPPFFSYLPIIHCAGSPYGFTVVDSFSIKNAVCAKN